MKNSQFHITKLIELLDGVKNRLPPDDINNIVESIENNEFGLAYEILCTQLYEYNLQISSGFYEKIAFYGKLIETNPSIWAPLRELIIDK
jgi:hypothetical protein